MHLNHVNLSVPDVQATVGFFEKHFGFTRQHTRGEDMLVVMRDDHDLVLTVSNFGKGATFDYPRDFHVGFIVESRARVKHQLYGELHEAGLAKQAPRTMHGAWAFYVKAPGDVTVEVANYSAN